MSVRTREQLIAEIEAVIRPGTTNRPKITAQDVRSALTTIVDELIARTSGQQNVSTLEFVFAANFDNEIRVVTGSQQAGSYRVASTQNATSVDLAVNGNVVAQPISLQSGDELTVTITRETSVGAIVKLESLFDDQR